MPCDDVKSATDNSLVRIDAGNGGVLQSTEAIVDDSGNMTVPGTVSAGGHECVTKEMFDANTVLAADSDNAPSALAVGQNTIVGRASGNIVALPIRDDNAIVGRQGGDIDEIVLAAHTLLGRAGGNIDDLTAAQVADILAATLKPKFISNAWYNQSPGIQTGFSTVGLLLDADTILYYLLLINQTVSFDVLGIHVVTAEAGKNARVGIYNSDATPQPTTLIVETDPLSLAAMTGVSDPVTETELTPGLYWWAINADSTTAKTRKVIASDVLGASVVAAVPRGKYTEAHALGAFPATATPVGPAYAGYVPAINFQVV